MPQCCKKLNHIEATDERTVSSGGKIFYGWWIVLACAGVQWLAAMTWMHSYGAYTLHLQDEFGWSMSILSLAFALTRLESGLLGPLQGWLVDRYGPRLILIIGTLIFGNRLLCFQHRAKHHQLFYSLHSDRPGFKPWRFRHVDGGHCQLV